LWLIRPEDWPPLGRFGALSGSTPCARAMARTSSPSRAVSFDKLGLPRTAAIGASVSVQNAPVPSAWPILAHTAVRISAVWGEEISFFSSMPRNSAMRGESVSSALPTTIMLLPGTLLTITPGSRTSFAE
jgi:hypothetical protein